MTQQRKVHLPLINAKQYLRNYITQKVADLEDAGTPEAQEALEAIEKLNKMINEFSTALKKAIEDNKEDLKEVLGPIKNLPKYGHKALKKLGLTSSDLNKKITLRGENNRSAEYTVKQLIDLSVDMVPFFTEQEVLDVIIPLRKGDKIIAQSKASSKLKPSEGGTYAKEEVQVNLYNNNTFKKIWQALGESEITESINENDDAQTDNVIKEIKKILLIQAKNFYDSKVEEFLNGKTEQISKDELENFLVNIKKNQDLKTFKKAYNELNINTTLNNLPAPAQDAIKKQFKVKEQNIGTVEQLVKHVQDTEEPPDPEEVIKALLKALKDDGFFKESTAESLSEQMIIEEGFIQKMLNKFLGRYGNEEAVFYTFQEFLIKYFKLKDVLGKEENEVREKIKVFFDKNPKSKKAIVKAYKKSFFGNTTLAGQKIRKIVNGELEIPDDNEKEEEEEEEEEADKSAAPTNPDSDGDGIEDEEETGAKDSWEDADNKIVATNWQKFINNNKDLLKVIKTTQESISKNEKRYTIINNEYFEISRLIFVPKEANSENYEHLPKEFKELFKGFEKEDIVKILNDFSEQLKNAENYIVLVYYKENKYTKSRSDTFTKARKRALFKDVIPYIGDSREKKLEEQITRLIKPLIREKLKRKQK